MSRIRLLKTPTVLLTLAFSFVSLWVLPTALCCQAVAESAPLRSDMERCPHIGEDGEACPMHRSSSSSTWKPGKSGCLTLSACFSPMTLLASLVTLTGAMPEPAFELESAPQLNALHLGSTGVSHLPEDAPDPRRPAPEASVHRRLQV